MSAETAGPRVTVAPPVVWAEGARAVARRPLRSPSVARTGAAVSEARIGVIVTGPRAEKPSRLRALLGNRAVRTHFGTVAGVVILSVLLWRLGTGVFMDGLRRIDGPTLLVGLGIGAVTTVFSAWRWALVARGLRIRLPLGPAVADYYRALFLNAALPGGVLGDVHRAVRHGQSAGDVGRGVRAVVLERTAGQLVLAVAGVTVLLTLPSPVMQDVRHIAPLVLLAGVGALAVVLAVRMNSSAPRRGGRLRAGLAEAREGLLSRRNGPGVAVSSAVVLAGHLGMFVVAAQVAGSDASVLELLPIAVLALLAMGLPLNVGGWGPREGVTAWAFGAAGLGASTGLAVAVVYGVLSFVAALPGAVVLVARWYAGLRAGAAEETGPGLDERRHDDVAAPAPESSPASDAPVAAVRVSFPEAVGSPAVSNEKYAPKESARLARSSFPFSADPREGRPMTPESV
ncbi:flippase-like domain-containing protein [Streptomyces asoensis]|uniref:Flippase-like domain-containing protein n=1 Tax=Streptomyces asoensis TaxID=249586 RepID=A0A6M4WXW7_9ACTN|nr:lysylphosphatidylglycerol synthase transmembrane domain-containing protein [Streptomyces asoensis]QJT05178.1 flippase-like domain-containing protein [Streptomyces asoensis]